MQLRSICWMLAIVLLELSSWTSSSSVPKELENNLMSLFGFKKRPNIDRTKVIIPEAMRELYNTGRRLNTVSIPKPGLHTKSANTVRSFTHIESPVDAKFPGHHKFRLKFDVTRIPTEERLKAAELTISRDIIEKISSHESGNIKKYYQHVLLSEIIKPGIKGKSGPIKRIIDSKLIDIRSNSTLSLDVLPAVQRWLESPKNNYGVIVEVLGNEGGKKKLSKHLRLRRDVSESQRTWSSRQPLLFTYTDDGKNKQVAGDALAAKRARRASNRRKKGKKEMRENCRRHSMYVDFEEVGWVDWIVAPSGYDAYYCHGECTFPLAEHLNTTNHAIIQTLMNSMSPSRVPKACCVPTQLSSISMLYLDDDNSVVLKNYQEMAVVGCGCR